MRQSVKATSKNCLPSPHLLTKKYWLEIFWITIGSKPFFFWKSFVCRFGFYLIFVKLKKQKTIFFLSTNVNFKTFKRESKQFYKGGLKSNKKQYLMPINVETSHETNSSQGPNVTNIVTL